MVRCLYLKAGQTVLDALFAPTGQLIRIEAVAAQPDALPAMRQRIGIGQQTLFFGRSEAATRTFCKPWIGRSFCGD